MSAFTGKCPRCSKIVPFVILTDDGNTWYDSETDRWYVLLSGQWIPCRVDLTGVERYLPDGLIFRSFYLGHRPDQCDLFDLDFDELFLEV